MSDLYKVVGVEFFILLAVLWIGGVSFTTAVCASLYQQVAEKHSTNHLAK